MKANVLAAILLFFLLESPRARSKESTTSRPLACYKCLSNSTLDCFNFTSMPIMECQQDQPYCKVARIQYLISDGDTTDGHTVWSTERTCSEKCSNFCVTMGTRTKFTYCTSCCDSPMCNEDNGGPPSALVLHHEVPAALMLIVRFLM